MKCRRSSIFTATNVNSLLYKDLWRFGCNVAVFSDFWRKKTKNDLRRKKEKEIEILFHSSSFFLCSQFFISLVERKTATLQRKWRNSLKYKDLCSVAAKIELRRDIANSLKYKGFAVAVNCDASQNLCLLLIVRSSNHEKVQCQQQVPRPLRSVAAVFCSLSSQKMGKQELWAPFSFLSDGCLPFSFNHEKWAASKNYGLCSAWRRLTFTVIHKKKGTKNFVPLLPLWLTVFYCSH